MNPKSSVFFCLLLFFCTYEATGQGRDSLSNNPKDVDLIDGVTKILHFTPKETVRRKGVAYFSIVPSSTSGQGGNKVLVSSINAAFYLGNPDSTYLSSVYFVPYTNLAKQYGFMSTQNIWTANNTWNIPGEFKIQNLSPYSYGLGSNSSRSDRFSIDYNYVRLYLTGNIKIVKYVFAGFGLNYDRQYDVRLRASTTSTPYEQYGIGTGSSSTSTGATFNALFDNRKNSINPDAGFYSTIVYRVNPRAFANDNTWTSLYADARKYFRLPTLRRNIIALWGFYWASYGNVPYLNLPGTTMEYNARSGRGYALGRFRGKQMLYLESEYRFTLSENGFWGGVLFANLQSLTEPVTHQFQRVNPAAGFGTRMKFNKKSNINLDIDFGFGKDSFDFYINLGEIF